MFLFQNIECLNSACWMLKVLTDNDATVHIIVGVPGRHLEAALEEIVWRLGQSKYQKVHVDESEMPLNLNPERRTCETSPGLWR